jgi:hypothetical protein
MPKNSFFRGKNPIKAWISDDKKDTSKGEG